MGILDAPALTPAALARQTKRGLPATGGKAPAADHTHVGQGFLSNGTDTTLMTRVNHTATRNMKQASLVFYGWFWDQSNLLETDNNGALTIRASVETSGGVMVPVFFNGKRDGTLEPGGRLQSDPISFEVAAGSTFFTRTFATCSAGTKFPLCVTVSNVARPGEGVETGTTVTDKTLTGTVATAETRGFGPSAILDDSYAGPIVALVGDSILAGQNDASTGLGGTTDIGFAVRALRSAKIPSIKVAGGGDKPSLFKTWSNARRRRNMVIGSTHAIYSAGINDIRNGVPLATLQTDTQAVWQWLADQGIKVYACTLGPKTTSTDSWATTANQTKDASESVRLGYNAWIRSTPAPLSGYFEVADTCETARDSGLWKVDGAASSYTADGLHPQTKAHQLMVAAVDTSVFTL